MSANSHQLSQASTPPRISPVAHRLSSLCQVPMNALQVHFFRFSLPIARLYHRNTISANYQGRLSKAPVAILWCRVYIVMVAIGAPFLGIMFSIEEGYLLVFCVQRAPRTYYKLYQAIHFDNCNNACLFGIHLLYCPD